MDYQKQKTSENIWEPEEKAGKPDFLWIFENPLSRHLIYKNFLNAMTIFCAIYQYLTSCQGLVSGAHFPVKIFLT